MTLDLIPPSSKQKQSDPSVSGSSMDRYAAAVCRAQAGEREAFGELFDRFAPEVVRVCLAVLRNRSDAQDVAQDVFVQAMEKIGQLRDPSAFGPWIRQIARRLSLNRLSRQRVRSASDPDALSNQVADGLTPEGHAMERERVVQLRGGLARLRPMDRETLVAFYLHGESLNEMSSAFAAPLGTIKRRLHVARRRLAKQLGA